MINLLKINTFSSWVIRTGILMIVFFTALIICCTTQTFSEIMQVFAISFFAAVTISFWWWIGMSIKLTYDRYIKVSEELNVVLLALKETQALLKLRAEEVTHDHHNDLGERRESTTD